MPDPRPSSAVVAVASPTAARIIGLDVARALAVVGMVLVNFKYTMGAQEAGSRGLRFANTILDGRAAATFVVLAGIGASLGSERARPAGDPALRRRARWRLARRAMFLLALGWAFYPIWPADILHYYGVYLAIGALVLFSPARILIALAAGAIALSFLFIVSFDYFANWDLDEISYRGIVTPTGFVRNLLFDGFHPVLPWVGFYLFGMWLGRTDLRNPRWRRRIAIRAAIIVAAAEAVAWIALGPKGSNIEEIDDQSWRWLLS
ncbi:MAG: heparan-alpha-glucosaminide N-acetyltransferase domain-containing protein, partial [Acidimicrobiales bacterium]